MTYALSGDTGGRTFMQKQLESKNTFQLFMHNVFT